MSYRIALDETPEEGIKRVICEQYDKALDALVDAGDAPDAVDEAVHDARKKLKKVRAALRLARFAFGEDTYQRENVAARDLGRALSDARDAKARIETLDLLCEAYEAPLDDVPFPSVREALGARLEAVRDESLGGGRTLGAVAEGVRAARRRISAAPFEGDDFEALAPGLAKTYRRGRKARRKAYGDPSVGRFHAWRKRAKYHRYHVRLLAALWPPLMKPWLDEVHRLTDLLGDAHDMAVLVDGLDGLDPDERKTLRGLAETHRRDLEAKARGLGAKLFADAPDALVDRMGCWWAAAMDPESV